MKTTYTVEQYKPREPRPVSIAYFQELTDALEFLEVVRKNPLPGTHWSVVSHVTLIPLPENLK